MTHFAGKAVKVLVLSGAMTLLLGATANAADLASGVGAITGTSVRMRSESSTSSQILNTLNKGTAVAVLNDGAGGWYQISFAGKTGYVSADYLVLDQDGVFTTYGRVNADGVNVRMAANADSTIAATLSEGTTFTINGITDGWYSVTCEYGTEGYVRSDFVDLYPSAAAASSKGAASAVVSLAHQYLGTRYVYGGASPSGFDCSGFTMYLYKQYGVSLPHTATGQWQSGQGTKVWSIGALQPGDLVFFCDPSRSLGKACSHAGVYIGGGQFIHSSSSRSNGVIVSDLTSGYYNTYFVGGLRVL